MRKYIGPFLMVVALVAAPLSLAGQQSGPPAGNRPPSPSALWRESGPGPVHLLLTNRVVLGLTTEQVTRLQEIDRKMEELNRPYVAQLLEIRRHLPQRTSRGREFTASEREAFDTQMRNAAPLLERIRQNNYLAMRAVGEVLTDQQEAKVRELIENERRRDGGRDSRRRSDDRRD